MSAEAGRPVRFSNLGKVFWPESGFTKGDLIDYYAAVAAAMVPHLAGRPVTLRRWPDGVEGPTFFQKHAPANRPEWMATVRLGEVDYLRIDEPAALLWAANSAAIEIHPGLATAPALDRPTVVVFDLDPGEGADILTCRALALILHAELDGLGLQAWPKTSGRKGLQIYVPVAGATFAQTRAFAASMAAQAESENPDLVVTEVERSKRRTKVLIDWAQNAPSRTTVAVYSVRARERPTVSTPLTWDELETARTADDLTFDTSDVMIRLDRYGDLMAPVLTVQQELPART